MGPDCSSNSSTISHSSDLCEGLKERKINETITKKEKKKKKEKEKEKEKRRKKERKT